MLNLRIAAYTLRFALLGGSLPHTWSPQIHNTLFDARAVQAIYLPLPVSGDVLPSAIEVLRASFSGFNVTIPYKQAVLPFMDELDALSSACGAVNTVRVGVDGSLYGYNTDGAGLLQALHDAYIDTSDCDVIVLGSGGTARMAACTLLLHGCRVTIAARSLAKAEELVKELALQQKDGAARLSAVPLDGLDQACDLLLNCTPVGMYPEENACPISRAQVAKCNAVFDAIYNPAQTLLLKYADEEGIKAVGGMGMLFYQAVEAQKIWLGRVPERKKLREIQHELESVID